MAVGYRLNLLWLMKHSLINPAWWQQCCNHDSDVIMGVMASQITSLPIVYLTVNSGTDQRKYQNSTLLVFVQGIRPDQWIPRIKGQYRGKCFHLVTSLWQKFKFYSWNQWVPSPSTWKWHTKFQNTSWIPIGVKNAHTYNRHQQACKCLGNGLIIPPLELI